MTASKPELLPCPFCGAEPFENAIEPHTHSRPLKALGIPDHSGSHVIECGCGAGMIAEAKQAVRDMWNRRKMYSYVQPRAGVPDVAGYESVHRVRQEAQMEAIRVRQAHEAARAADKARIAAQQWLLEQCQQSLRENSETYVELDAYLRGDIDHSEVLAIKAEHEAALSQQGKEGQT